ncbi:hypothetical protein [Spongorhabdus nitratireducens]
MSSSTYQAPSSGSFVISGRFWQRLAYRHKYAEATLYLMFISGIVIWDWVEIGWQVERIMLLAHLVAGLTAFPLLVGPFWASHRSLITLSNKPFLRATGKWIEWLLIICTLSGIYLLFWGNPGNWLGELMQDLHFYSSVLLVPLVFRHAMRWTVLKVFRRHS